jgi:protein O-GlcNAc transferase
MELTLDEALQHGVEAHQAGQIQEAYRLYASVLKAQPNHAEANHNVAVLAVSLDKIQEALPFFKTALEANPSIDQFWQSYIDALMKLGRLAEAKTVLNQAKNQGVNSETLDQLEQQCTEKEFKVSEITTMEGKKASSFAPNILDTIKVDKALKLAKRKRIEGLLDEAKSIYQDIVQKFPKNKQALIALKSLTDDALLVILDPPSEQLQSVINLYTQGQLQQALSDANQMLKSFSTSVVLNNIAGASNAGLLQFDAAINNYKQILRINPYHADAYYNLGIVQKGRGDLEAAIDSYKQAIKIKPEYPEAYYNMGVAQQDQEDLDSALDSYKQAINIKPDYAQAYNNMGNVLNSKRDPERAIDSFKQAIKHKPDYAQAYNNMGVVLHEEGDLAAAIDSYKQALKIKPNYADAYNNMGLSLNNSGDFDAALDSYKKAVKNNPDYADAYNNMGNTLHSKGDLESAIQSYKQVIKIKPDHADAYNNMGNALHSKGDLESAIQSYKQVLKIKPDHADAYNNMGISLKENGDLDAAIHSYKKAIKIRPDYSDAYRNMGLSLRDRGDLDSAIDCYKQAIQISPDHAGAYNSLGISLRDKGVVESAIECYKQAIKIKPDYADAYSNMGISMHDKGDAESAIGWYKQATNIMPNFADPHHHMGVSLQEKGELTSGIKSFEMALKFKPDYQSARAYKLHLQAYICDWAGTQEDQNLIPTLGTAEQPIAPFGMIALEDAPERHRLRSEIYAKSTFKQSPLPLAPKQSQKPKRLRIGYFSADFKNHPVMYALIEMLEQHDRALFEVYAYSFGPDSNSEMRQRVMGAVDVFNHVKDMDDKTIALLARQDKIDIAIDLTGYTRHSRTEVFAYRAAPVQIAMLGYPGTSGTNFIDYIMADQTLLPTENQKFFSEKPIYMPYYLCALEANIPLSDTTPTRTELGLPEEGFVFCAINNTYKITPAEFDIWMRLLRQVDGSVLWLLESNQWVRGNLVKEAEARGIDAERLVFQPLMVTDAASQQQYLSQFRQADLYLDTFTYGAGSTACNALWAGLPVLTLIGQGMPTRMAASYLNSLGLSELITTTDAAYGTLALELSKNPQRLALLKQTLGAACQAAPLFDSALQTKYLENGYQQAYQRYFDDQLRDAIFVPEHLL